MNKSQFKKLIKECVDEVIQEKKWIQKAINPKHKGYCTPMTKSTCTPRRKALAKRFKSGDLSENEDKIPGKFINRHELKLEKGVDPNLAKDMANRVWYIESSENHGGIYHFKTRGQSYCCAVGMMNGQPVLVSKTTDSGLVNVLTKDEIDQYYPMIEGINKDKIKETTTTSAVQGFYGKNWVDPDPKRSKMKNIAKKSVGGDLA